MTSSRLAFVAPDLAKYLEGLIATELRAVALSVVRAVLVRIPLNDDRITQGMKLLESQATDVDRAPLEALVSELDEVAWYAQERSDDGLASTEEYDEAFSRARAANTLFAALDPDPLVAAREALYEGQAATDDLTGIELVARSASA